MIDFMTIVSWVLGIVACLRVIGITHTALYPTESETIIFNMSRKHGFSPIWDAYKLPLITLVLTISWIISN